MGDNRNSKDNKKIMNVHLVAWGYEGDFLNLKTYSPTCIREAIHLVKSTASVVK